LEKKYFLVPLDFDCLTADFRSLGVIIWELWHGQHPWSALSAEKASTAVLKGEILAISLSSACPPLLADLLTRCFKRDPTQRPSAKQVVEVMEKLVASLQPKVGALTFPPAPFQARLALIACHLNFT